MQGFLSLPGDRELTSVSAREAVARAEAGAGAGAGGLPDGSLAWVHLVEPTPRQLAPVAEALDLPPLAVEDALHAHQRAKYERYGDELVFFVLRTLCFTETTGAVDTGELLLFRHPRWLVTVQHGPSNAPETARRRLAEQPGLLEHGAHGLTYALMDAVVDAYVVTIAQLSDALESLERDVFTPERIDYTQQIYSLKREVLEFRSAVRPLVPVAHELMSPETLHYPKPLKPYFRDVADHILRVANEVTACEELTGSILDAHSTQAGIWQNEDMRKISAWAAIIAAPTAIAGIYGMNFPNMPELHWALGYPFALALMALTCALLYRAFRRNGWL